MLAGAWPWEQGVHGEWTVVGGGTGCCDIKGTEFQVSGVGRGGGSSGLLHTKLPQCLFNFADAGPHPSTTLGRCI